MRHSISQSINHATSHSTSHSTGHSTGRAAGGPWSRRLFAAAGALAFAALLSGGAYAQHGHEGHHAATPESALLLAHAGHESGTVAPSAPGSYARSVRNYTVPDIALVDRDAKPVRLRELLAADEPVMMNFIFTSCTAICPVMSAIFAEVPRQLGGEGSRLRLISISIDPEHDTPKQLAAYAGRFGAGPRWAFLTGTVEDIAGVQQAFDELRGDKMSHEPLTLLRAAPGQPWVRIDGMASAEDLAREYRSIAAR